MPKWISIDEAVHKYEVKEEDVCLWAETEGERPPSSSF